MPPSPARSPWAAVKATAAGAAATLSALAAGVFGSPSRVAPVFGSPSNSSPVACPSSAPRQLNFGDATLPTALVDLSTTAKLVRSDASLAEYATFLCAGAQSFEVGCVAESPEDSSLPRRALEWRHCVEHPDCLAALQLVEARFCPWDGDARKAVSACHGVGCCWECLVAMEAAYCAVAHELAFSLTAFSANELDSWRLRVASH